MRSPTTVIGATMLTAVLATTVPTAVSATMGESGGAADGQSQSETEGDHILHVTYSLLLLATEGSRSLS
jgi:hypothetical protein